jgi:hypothetical protein
MARTRISHTVVCDLIAHRESVSCPRSLYPFCLASCYPQRLRGALERRHHFLYWPNFLFPLPRNVGAVGRFRNEDRSLQALNNLFQAGWGKACGNDLQVMSIHHVIWMLFARLYSGCYPHHHSNVSDLPSPSLTTSPPGSDGAPGLRPK